MSKPQYLVHHTNGTILGYSPILANRADMIAAMDIEEARSLAAKRGNTSAANPPKTSAPTPSDLNTQTNDDPPAYDADGNFIISNASAAELAEFAQEHYGVRLSIQDDINDLRHQVAELAKGDDETSADESDKDDQSRPQSFDVESATKVELAEFAESNYEVSLDKRKSADDLKAQVRDLMAGKSA